MIPITDDLFDIACRLRSVCDAYRLYYNTCKRRYEVYTECGLGKRLEFAVPFEQLDCRTVEYARKTRVERAQALFEEIEQNNRQVAQRQIQAAARAGCDKEI